MEGNTLAKTTKKQTQTNIEQIESTLEELAALGLIEARVDPETGEKGLAASFRCWLPFERDRQSRVFEWRNQGSLFIGLAQRSATGEAGRHRILVLSDSRLLCGRPFRGRRPELPHGS